MSHLPFLHRHRARVARLATLIVVTSAFGWLQAAQSAPSSGGAPKKEHSLSEKTSEAFGKLKPLQEKQDWAGMLTLLDSLQLAPGSYDEALVLDMKAKLYATTNQLSKAIAPWERSVELSDQSGYFSEKQTLETVALLAQLFGQEGSTTKDPVKQQEYFGKSVKYFKRYLDKTPKPTPEIMMAYASILYYRATADANKADPALLKEARKIVEQGLLTAIKPKEGFYQLLLTLQQQQNDFAGSAETLELMLKQAPNKKDYWQMLMAIYLQLSEKTREKDPKLARDYMTRAIVTIERAQALGFLNTPKDNMNLVTLYLTGANQFTKGTELLYNGMKSGKIENEPNNWRVLGRFYAEANMNEQAATVLMEAAKLFPTKGEIEVQLAQLYLQMEKSREALQHELAAVQKGNFDTTKPFAVYYLLAYTAYDLGELDQAMKAIQSAEKYPEDAKKDPQFPKLKAVIAEAITERENRAKEKDDKDKKKTAEPKKTASR